MRRSRLTVMLLILALHAGWAMQTASSKDTKKPAAEKKKPNTTAPEPRDGEFWQKRHASFNERIKKGNVDLLLIGDSITHAWENAGKEMWQKYYEPRHAANLGIGGDQTQHVLWRLDHGNVDGIKPKLAVLMIGTNNSGANSPEEIADGIKAIVNKLHEKLPETKVLILAIFPRGGDKTDAKRIVNQKTNEIIKKLDNGSTVRYLDIGPKFLNDDETLSKEIMPDLLHLSPKGYAIWAESIEPTVKEMMGEK
ncbi:MAG: platelet-activating factor acetylhydrolase IB subunit [Planctomycetaceae bacterium]